MLAQYVFGSTVSLSLADTHTHTHKELGKNKLERLLNASYINSMKDKKSEQVILLACMKLKN